MFWYDVLRQQTLAHQHTIAIGISVLRTHVHSPHGCGVEVSLDSARKPARLIFKTAETSQPERIDEKSREGNRPLQARVEVSCTERDAIVHESLIETTVNADRLLRFQCRIAKTNHARRAKVSLTKPFKQRRRAKTVAGVRSQLRTRAANEVCDGPVTGSRTLGLAALQHARTIRTPDAIPLPAHTNREAQSIVKKRQLILSEDRKRPLAIRGVVESRERRGRALEQRLTLELKSTRKQIGLRKVKIHATVDCVDVAIVDVLKLEIAKRHERCESRIDCWSIVIATIARHSLVRN